MKNNFSTKKLGEVIDMNFGERITRTNNSGNKYPVYGGGGESFRTDKFNRENEYVISRFAIAENCVRFVEGKFWLMDSGGTFSVRKDFENKLDKNFVGNVLLMRQKEIYNCARGGAQKNIDVNFFKKIKIPLPSLATQKQIVERLDKIAEARKLNDDLIQKSNELFQSLLHSLIRANSGIIKKLGEIAEIIMGQSPPSSTYNENAQGLPFFQGKAEFGEIYPTPVKYCPKPTRIAEAGDILMSVRAPVGNINLAKERSGIGRGLGAIRARKGVDQSFLYFFFTKNESNWARLSVGSTFLAIRRNNLDNLEVSVPPLETQKKVVEKLSSVQNYKKQLLEQKIKLKELFDSVLYKSFQQI